MPKEEKVDLAPIAQRGTTWRTARRVLGVLYGVVAVASFAHWGVPFDRVGISLWILAALAISLLGKGWRAWGTTLLDWIPFTAVMFAYDYAYVLAGSYAGGVMVEGSLNPLGFPLHVTAPVHVDTWLFGGVLPNEWLQSHFYVPGQTHWYDVLTTLVYSTHFVATPLVAMVLWLVSRRRFRAYVGCVMTLAVAGIATYVVYPMAPPWMASQQGVIGRVARASQLGWDRLDLHRAGDLFQMWQGRSNQVAAMPSLHMAFATLIALFFMVGAPWWRRVLLACYPLMMGTALVYSGEHYVVDLIVGVLYSVVIVAGWRLIHRWRVRGRPEPDIC